MAAVKIVTDSTHNLPPDMVARHGFGVVSLYVNEGEATTRESDLDLGAFYDRLRAADDLPTTSQPSLGDFLTVYEPLLAAGHDVVSVHISAGVSGTIETALQAAAEAQSAHPGRRVEIVDSNSIGGGTAMSCSPPTPPPAAAPMSTPSWRGRRRRGRPRGSGSRSTRSSTCAAAAASAPRKRSSAAR